jgi:uncharacterized membrane protein
MDAFALVWKQIVLLVLVTFIPGLELRASIPIGILYGSSKLGIESNALSWPLVVLICVLANILLGWGVFFAMQPAMRILERFTWFRTRVEPILERTRRKLHPYVEKYGEIGVAVFIGIPLPMSGVYTGAVGAFALGVGKRQFAIANVIGVLIAATAVTVVTLLLRAGVDLPWLQWMLKH